uniref:BTB domain-containing protein n=1 Tax=Brassica campestris TaxID=3711 RepID=M4E3S0_BRACM
MASFKVGSKSEVFHLSGHTWLNSTGLKPDVMIQVQDQTFHLHKFPLLSRSGYLETLFSKASESTCVAQLHDIPGGPDTFLLVAKFCYGARTEITTENVASLRCAAEYLQMSENYGDANLITLTESFLNDTVFTNWNDSIKALESCEHKLIPLAEELHIVTRCIASLANKASYAEDTTTSWNGIQTKSTSGNWWFNDVSSFLNISMYKRFIKTIESRGVKADIITASVTHYAKRNLPLLGSSRHCGSSSSEEGTNRGDDGIYYSNDDQKSLLEEIVELLPSQKCATSTRFLLRLLRTSMVLRASAVTRGNLERKIGVQLDEAALEDLLIPNMGNSAETLYDIDSVQRILDHFMLTFDTSCHNNVEEKQIMVDDHSLMPITKVASLIDGYLAEVASDENLKLSKFQALGALVPQDVRPMDDGIYRAIDIYIKIAGWFFDTDSDNDDTSGKCYTQEGDNGNANMVMNGTMKERVYELEKEWPAPSLYWITPVLWVLRTLCHPLQQSRFMSGGTSMKQDLDKLVKTKEGRSFFSKLFGLRSKTKTSPGDKDGLMKE